MTPNLYACHTVLSSGGRVVDVAGRPTGFRQTEFNGGAGTGGVCLNGHFVWLAGYAQRSTNEWAGAGPGLSRLDARLQRAAGHARSNANYIRWMHISPQRVDVRRLRQCGIVEICPAGDKEADVHGRQWEQRLEVMRDR